MQYVFIDSTSYYSLAKNEDGITHLDYIIKLASEGKFKIVFPKITQVEISRGLLGSIESTKKDEKNKKNEKDQRIIITSPLENFSEDEKGEIESKKKELEDLIKEAEKNHAQEESKIRNEVAKKILSGLRNSSTSITPKETPELVNLAYARWLKKYPPTSINPQKPTDRLGDCLAWELMLENCDDDLIIVSYDGDWVDNSDLNRLHPFLEEEWHERKGNKKIELLKTIGEFLQRNGIKISKKDIEEEKSALPPFGPSHEYGSFLREYEKLRRENWLRTLSSGAGTASGPSIDPFRPTSSPPYIVCRNCSLIIAGTTIACPYCGTLLP